MTATDRVMLVAALIVVALLLATLTPPTSAHPLHDFSERSGDTCTARRCKCPVSTAGTPIATVFVPLILRGPAATPEPTYTSARDTYNCADFATQSEAQVCLHQVWRGRWRQESRTGRGSDPPPVDPQVAHRNDMHRDV